MTPRANVLSVVLSLIVSLMLVEALASEVSDASGLIDHRSLTPDSGWLGDPPPVSGGTTTGGFLLGGVEQNDGHGNHASPVGSQVRTSVVDCGPVSLEGSPLYVRGICTSVHPACDVAAASALP